MSTPAFDPLDFQRICACAQEQWERDGYVRKGALGELINNLPKFHTELEALRVRALQAEAALRESRVQRFLPLALEGSATQ